MHGPLCIPTDESNGLNVVTALTDIVIPRCGIALVVEHLVQDQEIRTVLSNHIEILVCEHIIFITSVEDPDCLAVVAVSRWVHVARGVCPFDLLELVTEVNAGGLGCGGGLDCHQGCW